MQLSSFFLFETEARRYEEKGNERQERENLSPPGLAIQVMLHTGNLSIIYSLLSSLVIATGSEKAIRRLQEYNSKTESLVLGRGGEKMYVSVETETLCWYSNYSKFKI